MPPQTGSFALAAIALTLVALPACSSSGAPATPFGHVSATNGTDILIGSANGIVEYSATTGASLATFGFGETSAQLGVDGAGHVFEAGYGSSGWTLSEFAFGATTPLATYAPSTTYPVELGVAPSGEIVESGVLVGSNNATSNNVDVWDPGVTGAPSRTFTNTGFPIALAGDGTLYYVSQPPAQVAVVAPGSSTPSRTIANTLTPAPATAFLTALTVGPDGTLYEGDYSQDANDGLYVFPPSGSTRFVTRLAAGIFSMDTDAAGDLFVASNTQTNAYQTDTSHQISVFTPQATALERQLNDVLEPDQVVAESSGAAYVLCRGCANDSAGIVYLAPGSSVLQPIVSGLSANGAGADIALLAGPSGVLAASRSTVFGLTSRAAAFAMRRAAMHGTELPHA